MSSSSSVPNLEWPIGRVRQTFIDFFVSKGCEFVASSSSIPHNDPTLLFANAGMNQFKTKFLGTTEENHPFYELKGACNSQKCIRAGGKHNDLDDVGRDTYHHTFFEMMGNWSFGDYFKKEAIAWAWELLTKVYKLDPERLYASYYEGDAELGLEPDTESYELWQQYIPKERIVPGNTKDNFWEMGETGPCGVSSEIHYDMIGGGRNAADEVNVSDDVIEIWNLVFIQYNRNEPNGALEKLTESHVDTGMGLERVTAILQDVKSNYDIDGFQTIFNGIQKLTNAPPYQGNFFAKDPKFSDMSYRVIADHMRTLTVAVSDGQSPGSTGRAYVLRRILRRAMFYAREYLHVNRVGFLAELVPFVVNALSEAYPSLSENQAEVVATIQDEEQRFADCLVKGKAKFNKVLSKLGADDEFQLDKAVLLYDSFGFPPDLTVRMLEQLDRKAFSLDAFQERLTQMKEESQSANNDGGVKKITFSQPVLGHLEDVIKAVTTDDSFKYAALEGTISAQVVAIFDGKEFVQTTTTTGADDGVTRYAVVLDRTLFYAESGGQAADHGVIGFEGGAASSSSSNSLNKFEVNDVQKFGKYVAHIGQLASDASSQLAVGAQVQLEIDTDRRQKLMNNHTMTHVLNWSLLKRLGDHITQKGSSVETHRFRFDFNQNSALTVKQLELIDADINQVIKDDLTVYDQVAPREKATSIEALRFLPDEIYPDQVRVVSIGRPVQDLLAEPDNPEHSKFSIEFCGGTHMQHTGQAERYVTLSDETVSSGVRRIVGATGPEAAQAEKNAILARQLVQDAKQWDAAKLQAENAQLTAKISDPEFPMVASVRRQLLRELDALFKKMMQAVKAKRGNAKAVGTEFVADTIEKFGQSPPEFFVSEVDIDGNRKVLGFVIQKLVKAFPNLSFMLMTVNSTAKKPSMAMSCVVPESVSKGDKKFSAGDWIKHTASSVGGKGGGRPTQGNGSTTQIDKLPQAIEVATSFAVEKGLKGSSGAASSSQTS